MRALVLVALLMLTGPALADEWNGDDMAYGTPSPSNPCDCAPGEDGVDWNGDGLSNPEDAAYAPPGAYTQGNPTGVRPGNSDRYEGGAMQSESGHGSSDGGRGPK